MSRTFRRWMVPGSLLIVLASWTAPARAASPTAEQALQLRPIQKDVEYSRPKAGEAAKCKITARKVSGQSGWIIEDANGLILREFFDTNGDNVVDSWSYFKDGLEVYRDVDIDFNGKADQYRWFHTGGCRWGLDKNEDGTIDQWKMISAEEVTAEVIAALADRNSPRFARLVLKPDELKSLGLGKERAASMAKKIGRISGEFQALAAGQKTVPPGAKWIQFSGTRPGIVPAGTDGSTRDLRVYENAIAIIEAGGKHAQVPIGTLVEIGSVWRVIDVPPGMTEKTADSGGSGFFFQTSLARSTEPAMTGPSEQGQKLLAELEKLDHAAAGATTPDQQAKLNARRADLLEQIAAEARSPEHREMWLKQLADMIGAAAQSGTYPGGVKRLETLLGKLKSANAKTLVPYVRFRQLTAAYGQALQAADPDYAKIQKDWLGALQQFVKDYPTSPDAAEAMLQLAIAQEFTGEEAAAKQWYALIVKRFPNSAAAKKAAGARRRLDSVGKQIAFSGTSTSGSPIDLAKYRGRVVLIQYWASWSDRAKADLPALKELVAKYGKRFSVIGVSVDSSRKELDAYLAENRLPWPQIHEEGGMDSRPANGLGILSVPTMILIDRSGKVVNRNVQPTELAAAVKKLVQ